jgi:ethanolamine utilization protein EutQ
MNSGPALDKATLMAIVREVIAEQTGGLAQRAAPPPVKATDPSGVIGIDVPRVGLEPFPFPVRQAEKVQLVDLLTTEESPRLGAGVMAMEDTWFEWTLTYDEVDYVLEGTLDIIVDGRTTRATAGQMVYIPKDTAIRFATPDKVRFLYFVYPANWAEN